MLLQTCHKACCDSVEACRAGSEACASLPLPLRGLHLPKQVDSPLSGWERAELWRGGIMKQRRVEGGWFRPVRGWGQGYRHILPPPLRSEIQTWNCLDLSQKDLSRSEDLSSLIEAAGALPGVRV